MVLNTHLVATCFVSFLDLYSMLFHIVFGEQIYATKF